MQWKKVLILSKNRVDFKGIYIAEKDYIEIWNLN